MRKWRVFTDLFFPDPAVRGSGDGSADGTDFQSVDLCRFGDGDVSFLQPMVCPESGFLFPGDSDSGPDRLDPFPHEGGGSRGYQIVYGRWLSEWRRRCSLQHLFIFPAGRRNLSRQIAESETTENQFDSMFSILYSNGDAEEN